MTHCSHLVLSGPRPHLSSFEVSSIHTPLRKRIGLEILIRFGMEAMDWHETLLTLNGKPDASDQVERHYDDAWPKQDWQSD